MWVCSARVCWYGYVGMWCEGEGAVRGVWICGMGMWCGGVM